ncbi:MAG: hypothetical protein IIU67_00430 [Lachnospiraceae bacterium]|nr:hypothetical protein [Lachnospiraceae bacterium]
MKNRITIGISSIVLIFMILCLAVFSLLSLSDAKSALTFAQKRAETVQIFYEADIEAQKFIRDYRAQDAEQKQPEAAVVYELPMRSGQTLHLELSADGSDILSYYVYNNTDYVIDSDLPVWGGN